MTTVHFVYPHGDRVSAPHAIGRKVGERLQDRYCVVHHEIDEVGGIAPGPGDVLLGHPHAAPWTVFRRSAARSGWRRKLLLMPYVHADTSHLSLADPVVRSCDLFLAVTGNAWFETVSESLTAHWLPKMVHVDLAIDRADFPRIKTSFAPPGRRRFLYIGHTQAYKNPEYLSAIAQRMPEAEVAWIGGGDPDAIPGVRALGRRDFATEEGRALVAGYDVFVTVGWGDANPSTILEAMAWGLVPACTPESGYVGYPGITNLPLGDLHAAVAVLRELSTAPEERLLAARAANDEALGRHFNWDRFAAQVVDAIESSEAPAVFPVPRAQRLRHRALALRSVGAGAVDRRAARSAARQLLSRSERGRALLARRRRRLGL